MGKTYQSMLKLRGGPAQGPGWVCSRVIVLWMKYAWLFAGCGVQVVCCLVLWRILKKMRSLFDDDVKRLRAEVAEALADFGGDMRRVRAEVGEVSDWVLALAEELRASGVTPYGSRVDDVRLDLIAMMNTLNEDTRRDFIRQERDEPLDNYLRELWNSRDNLRAFMHPEQPRYRRPPLAPGAVPLNWYAMVANLEEIDPGTQEIRLVDTEHNHFRALLNNTQANLG